MERLKLGLKLIKETFWHFTSFVLLLTLYLLNTLLIHELSKLHLPRKLLTAIQSPWSKVYLKFVPVFDFRTTSISRLDLIDIAIRNMQGKRVRSTITVGGMAIGIGAIVFLVSIGYGLEHLVISRVARLDEMRQIDVSPQTGGKIKITDKTLNDFKEIGSVEKVLPLIAVVGRVNYQSSVSDMAVYGVTTEYLKQSAIRPVQGKIFDSEELSMEVPYGLSPEVVGVSTESLTGQVGEKIQDVEFTISPNQWIRVREKPDPKSKILGYTKRTEGTYSGEEYWGGSYEAKDNIGSIGRDENGDPLGKWIKAKIYLWENKTCDIATQPDCERGKFLPLKEDLAQVQREGYFAEVNVNLAGSSIKEANVLGVTTQKEASDTVSLTWVEIASEAGVIKPPDSKSVSLGASAVKQAVVNRAMLKVLGIKEGEAVGKTFSASYVVVGDLLSDSKERIESEPAEYSIVGVTPDDKTPIFYVPFIDLRTLGITNYSQGKVVVKSQADLAKSRKQIEAMGYVTRSVADTVAQITSLFTTAKTILALLGMVALSVAALGMFNTLTVSLLERIREVGLMKAMGMKSSEVQELFLTESMIMGFFGGILGIILGFIAGKLVGVILSFLALFKGVGIVDVSYIPPSFVLGVIILSLLVGILTGIYPARRATKISALDALRYE